jgi:hypothetical protein
VFMAARMAHVSCGWVDKVRDQRPTTYKQCTIDLKANRNLGVLSAKSQPMSHNGRVGGTEEETEDVAV